MTINSACLEPADIVINFAKGPISLKYIVEALAITTLAVLISASPACSNSEDEACPNPAPAVNCSGNPVLTAQSPII